MQQDLSKSCLVCGTGRSLCGLHHLVGHSMLLWLLPSEVSKHVARGSDFLVNAVLVFPQSTGFAVTNNCCFGDDSRFLNLCGDVNHVLSLCSDMAQEVIIVGIHN